MKAILLSLIFCAAALAQLAPTSTRLPSVQTAVPPKAGVYVFYTGGDGIPVFAQLSNLQSLGMSSDGATGLTTVAFTLPSMLRMGTVLPPMCLPGDSFAVLPATGGGNPSLSLCTAMNVWATIIGSGTPGPVGPAGPPGPAGRDGAGGTQVTLAPDPANPNPKVWITPAGQAFTACRSITRGGLTMSPRAAFDYSISYGADGRATLTWIGQTGATLGDVVTAVCR